MHSRYFDFPEIPADGVGKRCHLINRLYGVCEKICFQKNYQLTHASYCESRTADRSTPHSEMRSLQGWEAWPHTHLNEKFKSINIC